MKIVVLGATGTIGRAVVAALASAHEVVEVSRARSARTVDMTDPAALRALFESIGRVDAIVCAAGGGAFKPLADLTDADFALSLGFKLMGQVNVIRFGLPFVVDGGSITVTSGVLSQRPMPGSGAISLVNAGLEGFVRAAALEAPRGIRVNVVSPPWVTDTLVKFGMDPSIGLTPEAVARAYVASVTGAQSGATLEP